MLIVIEPRIVTDFETFKLDTPPNSIALDGRVSGPPIVDLDTKHANCNHHEKVIRLVTASTSEQVLIAIKTWLSDTFDMPTLNMYINDPDQDTALALWLLINHDRLEWVKSEPLISRLIGVLNKLDITSGMYPFGVQSPVMKQLAWIFDPYVDSRKSWELYRADAGTMRSIIDSIHGRINKHLMWNGEMVNLDTEFNIIWWGKNWSLVVEKGFYARANYLEKWIMSFMSLNKVRPDGKYIYSIWKVSNYIKFPILEIYIMLNKAEWISEESTDKWGWSDTIWWSPRNSWSKLSPDDITRLINDFLTWKEKTFSSK